MNEADFHDGLRDDADDALVRHAYADFLDERAAPTAEFHRLSGDLLGVEPGSVDAMLIEARRQKLFCTVVESRWAEEFRAAGVNRSGWQIDQSGMAALYGERPSNPECFAELATRLPVYRARSAVVTQLAKSAPEHDWSWLRALAPVRLDMLPMFAKLLPDVIRRLRSVSAPFDVPTPIPIGDLCPHLHRLALPSAGPGRAAENFAGLHELRHLRLDELRRDLATVLRALPDSLRTLDLPTGEDLRPLSERLSPGVEFPELERLCLRLDESGSLGRFDHFVSSPLLETVSSLELVGATSIDTVQGHRPEPPLRLRHVRIDSADPTVPLLDACVAWGPQLETLSIPRGETLPSCRFMSLCQSETLTELELPAGEEFLMALANSPLGKRLQRLSLTRSPENDDLRALARLDLPSLRALEIAWDQYGELGRPLGEVFDAPWFRSLELVAFRLRPTLHPEDEDFPESLPERLVDALGDRLRVLHLDAALLSDALAYRLTESDLPFRLDRFSIAWHDSRLTPDARELLTDAFPHLVSEERTS